MEFRRIRRRYDHRSREIARETGDIELAVTNGVPRSTARDWSCLAESDHARHRSHVRPHSSLSCRPPAPETILSRPPVSASRRLASISILEFNQRLNQEGVSFRGGRSPEPPIVRIDLRDRVRFSPTIDNLEPVQVGVLVG